MMTREQLDRCSSFRPYRVRLSVSTIDDDCSMRIALGAFLGAFYDRLAFEFIVAVEQSG